MMNIFPLGQLLFIFDDDNNDEFFLWNGVLMKGVYSLFPARTIVHCKPLTRRLHLIPSL